MATNSVVAFVFLFISLSYAYNLHYEWTDIGKYCHSLACVKPGETRNLTIYVTNTGAETWSSNDITLRPQNSIAGWTGLGSPLSLVNATVKPGQIAAFSAIVKAPATTIGLHRFIFKVSKGQQNTLISKTLNYLRVLFLPLAQALENLTLILKLIVLMVFSVTDKKDSSMALVLPQPIHAMITGNFHTFEYLKR